MACLPLEGTPRVIVLGQAGGHLRVLLATEGTPRVIVFGQAGGYL